MQILIWVMMIVGGAAGLLSTAYLVLAMPDKKNLCDSFVKKQIIV